MNRLISFSLLAASIVSWTGCGSQPSADQGARLNGAGSTFAYPSPWTA